MVLGGGVSGFSFLLFEAVTLTKMERNTTRKRRLMFMCWMNGVSAVALTFEESLSELHVDQLNHRRKLCGLMLFNASEVSLDFREKLGGFYVDKIGHLQKIK